MVPASVQISVVLPWSSGIATLVFSEWHGDDPLNVRSLDEHVVDYLTKGLITNLFYDY